MKHEAEMAKLQNENEKLKGLLKKAVEDFREIAKSHDCFNPDADNCGDCVLFHKGECDGWKREDEVMKLIGGGENE